MIHRILRINSIHRIQTHGMRRIHEGTGYTVYSLHRLHRIQMIYRIHRIQDKGYTG